MCIPNGQTKPPSIQLIEVNVNVMQRGKQLDVGERSGKDSLFNQAPGKDPNTWFDRPTLVIQILTQYQQDEPTTQGDESMGPEEGVHNCFHTYWKGCFWQL